MVRYDKYVSMKTRATTARGIGLPIFMSDDSHDHGATSLPGRPLPRDSKRGVNRGGHTKLPHVPRGIARPSDAFDETVRRGRRRRRADAERPRRRESSLLGLRRFASGGRFLPMHGSDLRVRGLADGEVGGQRFDTARRTRQRSKSR